MKFSLVNPKWDFTGSTYFGCRDPHLPLELMFAQDQILAAGHEAQLLDAHRVKRRTVRRRARYLHRGAGFVCVNDGPALASVLARLVQAVPASSPGPQLHPYRDVARRVLAPRPEAGEWLSDLSLDRDTAFKRMAARARSAARQSPKPRGVPPLPV